MRQLYLVLAVGTLALLVTMNAACGEGNYLFIGRAYDEAGQCFGPSVAVDVLSGNDPSTCSNRCIRRFVDGGTSLVVSNMCGPIPVGFAEIVGAECEDTFAFLPGTCTTKDAH